MISKEFLSRSLYCYGIITFLMVLEHFEQEEDFMTCKMMIDTIEEHNARHKDQLPKRLEENLFIEKVLDYKNYGFNVSKEQIFERQKDYAYVLIEDLKK